ncbi:hypothetical protein PR048_009522 [Dryococelus australis]|uniref:PiggyBac transposable element-derived protein domain-containing protein n=1 Tax=Dryococelus australis TaxID=614101 RepID=A0ABQ9I0V8_9NEOP|nr:hypothetical protein PR048_009522 [Dryococelus australis]
MKRGDTDNRVSSMDICVFKWFDRKGMLLASNFHGTLFTKCPEILKYYSLHMGGVDHADRLRAVYGINRHSKNWWHRLFWAMVEITFVNAHVIHSQLFHKTAVAQGFMNKNISRLLKPKNMGRRKSTATEPPKRRTSSFSVPLDSHHGNRSSHWVTYAESRGRCEVCSENNIQSRPHSKCSLCGIFICSS